MYLIRWLHQAVAAKSYISDVSFALFLVLEFLKAAISSNCSNDEMQTIGPGLEWDVVYTAFNSYIWSFAKWFALCFDSRASL